MRLNHLSAFKGQSEKLFLPFIVFLIALDTPLLWGLFILSLWVVYKKSKVFFIALVGLCIVFFVRLELSKLSEVTETKHRGIIARIEKEREYPRFKIITDDHRLLVYHDELSTLRSGDEVLVKGVVEKPSLNGFFGGFDYQSHLKSNNVDGIIYEADLNSKTSTLNRFTLRGYVESHIETYDQRIRPYLEAFILANRDGFEDSTYQQIGRLGLMHLFAISGLHIGLMSLAFRKGLSLFLSVRLSDNILMVFLVLFLFISGAPPSVLRAVLFTALIMFNHRMRLGFTPLDLMGFLCIAILLYRPYFYVNIGFQLSFLVSYLILLSQPMLKGQNKLKQLWMISSMAFLFTMPLILSIQYSVNLLSPILNIFFGVFLSSLLLPLVYLTFLSPWLSPLLITLIDVFETMINMSTRYLYLPLNFYIPSGIWRLIYFLLLIYMYQLIAMKRVWIFSFFTLVAYLSFIAFKPNFNPMQQVIMYDVIGDAFLIKDRFNACNILIDTGESDEHQNLANALKRRNIRQIDIFFITHDHYDHMGAKQDIIDNFTVKRLWTSDDQQAIENTWMQCGNIPFFVYPKNGSFQSLNNQSLVKKMIIGNDHYLFTGDMELEREEAFNEIFNENIDILKVAHHGSNTSTHQAFLSLVKPDIALIPAHRQNRFDFPSEAVINRLRAHTDEIYITKSHGSVKISYIFDYRMKKTALSD